ncbi:MAG: hypothetical protein JF599_13955 [Verrucomicrobia bacterium]|nr:hypothetical protein [Verrucomicrobiota bacterium]
MSVKSEPLSALDQRREQKARSAHAANHADDLFREATKEGEGGVFAADQLIQLSIYATALVEMLSRRTPSVVSEAALRREDFPMLWSRHEKTRACYERMIKKVKPGSSLPVKVTTAGQERAISSGLKKWLRGEVIPTFDRMRLHVPAALGAHNLGALSSKSIDAWVEVITAYVWENYPEAFTDPNSLFYQAANTKRAVGRKRARRIKTLRKKYDGELDALDATRKQVRAVKIAETESTKADIKNGFKEAVKRCLVGLVKK